MCTLFNFSKVYYIIHVIVLNRNSGTLILIENDFIFGIVIITTTKKPSLEVY